VRRRHAPLLPYLPANSKPDLPYILLHICVCRISAAGREIAAVLDLSWVHAELASYYPQLGRPSIDPVLMIRMLIIGYVFAIRSEGALCRDVQVNLAYRWFCGLSIEDQTIRRSRVRAMIASAIAASSAASSSVL
jgi:Transposase domain (DUF772)